MIENWKWIPGFEGKYQASNLGRIKSFKINKKDGQIMKGNVLKDGRVRINLEGTKYLVHRLVLQTFVEQPDEVHELVLHLDGDPTNNSLENLKWGSYKDNANDELMFARCAQKKQETQKQRNAEQNLVIENEVWKDIEGYENEYQISNMGRVKSLKNKNTILIMSPILSRTQNYYTIGLTKNGQKKHYSVNRLVAEAFVPNPNNYKEVNHIDENTKNNRADNLEWVEHSQNVRHSIYRQSYPVLQYDLNHNLINKFPSLAEANRQTGVPRQNISASIKRNGTSGGFIWEYDNDYDEGCE